jgi:hypothetical protein
LVDTGLILTRPTPPVTRSASCVLDPDTIACTEAETLGDSAGVSVPLAAWQL